MRATLESLTEVCMRILIGHSLKSSLVHSIIMDRRVGGTIFPTRGTLLEFRTEYAGAGGDIGFLKNELKLQSNFCLYKDFVLQGSFQGGLMNEFQDNKRVKICDRFFLGGPLTIRGFEFRGAGPHTDRYALGSEMYWATALHLYGPLPFRIFEKSFGELFRTHLFVNAGNIGKFDRGRDYRDFFKQMVTGTRMSCGLGVAVKLHSARVEFNYCVPLSMQTGDRATKGFHFGIGLFFL
ncbi:hypothetical protein B566_EDAN006518 [Ephemera danica]|nr:hypothetical protein B566_EDAN006518 [Ephemera danica]